MRAIMDFKQLQESLNQLYLKFVYKKAPSSKEKYHTRGRLLVVWINKPSTHEANNPFDSAD